MVSFLITKGGTMRELCEVRWASRWVGMLSTWNEFQDALRALQVSTIIANV